MDQPMVEQVVLVHRGDVFAVFGMIVLLIVASFGFGFLIGLAA